MLTIQVKQEEDGRWIAEEITLPRALTYGATEVEARLRAVAQACRVMADLREHGDRLRDAMPGLFASTGENVFGNDSTRAIPGQTNAAQSTPLDPDRRFRSYLSETATH